MITSLTRRADISKKHEEDLKLAAACAKNAPGAWDKLVDRYGSFVLGVIGRTARFYKAQLSGAEYEDVLQEVFLSLVKNNFRALGAFRGDSSLASWLRRIAVNKTIDHLKTRSPLPGMLAHVQEHETSTAGKAEKKEELSRVRRVLDSLTDRERMVVKLFYFEHRKYREIAELLGIPENSVGPVLARALLSLKNLLQKS